MTRRESLKLCANGFGMLGLAGVLHAEANRNLLAPKAPQFPAKAKNVIFLFLNGGISQVDAFDPKPMLTKNDGQPMPGPKIKTDRASGNLIVLRSSSNGVDRVVWRSARFSPRLEL